MTKQKIFRVFPGLDCFELNGVFLPYVDIIADDADAAYRGVKLLIPDLDEKYSRNTMAFIHQVNL